MKDINGIEVKQGNQVMIISRQWMLTHSTHHVCIDCIDENDNRCCIGRLGVVTNDHHKYNERDRMIDCICVRFTDIAKHCVFWPKDVRVV